MQRLCVFSTRHSGFSRIRFRVLFLASATWLVAFLLGSAVPLGAQTGIGSSLATVRALQFEMEHGERDPEYASDLGLYVFDSLARVVFDDIEEEDLAFYKRWTDCLEEEMSRTADSELKRDLGILADHTRLKRDEIEVNQKCPRVPFDGGGPAFVYESVKTLLDSNDENRRKAAVERFRKYVRGDRMAEPYLEALQSRHFYLEDKYQGEEMLWPSKAEIEEYLRSDFVKQLRCALEKSKVPGWREDFEVFEGQVKKYDDFVHATLLAKARKETTLPANVYVFALRKRGICATPDELIKEAEADFKNTFADFERKAEEVRDAHHFAAKGPAAVLHALRKETSKPVSKDEAQKMFRDANDRIEQIIQQKQLITLPDAKVVLEVSDGDGDDVPGVVPPKFLAAPVDAPSVIIPFPVFTDLDCPPAARALFSHECRPGHELIMRRTGENRDLSLMRKIYVDDAMHEGWALYAEQIMYPHLDTDAQLVLLPRSWCCCK